MSKPKQRKRELRAEIERLRGELANRRQPAPSVEVGDDAEVETGRITITHSMCADGQDYVRVESDDLAGGSLGIVEALGLVELAKLHLSMDFSDDESEADDE